MCPAAVSNNAAIVAAAVEIIFLDDALPQLSVAMLSMVEDEGQYWTLEVMYFHLLLL